MTPVSFWTDLRIKELKFLWASGDSAALIGRAMDISRNAVLGKVHRLKLEPRSVLRVAERTFGARPRAAPNRIYHRSVFKMPERKPSFHAPAPNAHPRLISVMSPITGAFMNVKRRLPHQAEMTKNELRAMLTQALINTAALS